MSESFEFIFREAESADVPSLARLRHKQLTEEGNAEIKDIQTELEGYFASSLADGSLTLYVATVQSTVVATGGYCHYRLPPTFGNPSGRVAYVTNMYTEPAFRRQGVSASLLERLMARAKRAGFTAIRLHASPLGKSIYERAGFVNSGGYMHLSVD